MFQLFMVEETRVENISKCIIRRARETQDLLAGQETPGSEQPGHKEGKLKLGPHQFHIRLGKLGAYLHQKSERDIGFLHGDHGAMNILVLGCGKFLNFLICRCLKVVDLLEGLGERVRKFVGQCRTTAPR